MCLFNRYYWVCSESFLVHSFLWWPQQPPIHEQQWEGLHHILPQATGRTLSSLWAASRFCSKQNTLQLTITQRDSWFAFQVHSGKQSLPIKAMLKSLPLWAIILNSFAFIWSNNLLVTYTPTYISTKLHVNVREVSGPFVLIFNFVNYSSLSLRVLWPSFSHCLLLHWLVTWRCTVTYMGALPTQRVLVQIMSGTSTIHMYPHSHSPQAPLNICLGMLLNT